MSTVEQVKFWVKGGTGVFSAIASVGVSLDERILLWTRILAAVVGLALSVFMLIAFVRGMRTKRLLAQVQLEREELALAEQKEKWAKHKHSHRGGIKSI